MKRRHIPLSALITGLLAAPGMGIAPRAGKLESQAPTVEAFPAEMPNSLAEEIRRVARGEPLDAFGMQKLQRRIAVRVQNRLAAVLAETARGEGLKTGEGAKGQSGAERET